MDQKVTDAVFRIFNLVLPKYDDRYPDSLLVQQHVDFDQVEHVLENINDQPLLEYNPPHLATYKRCRVD